MAKMTETELVRHMNPEELNVYIQTQYKKAYQESQKSDWSGLIRDAMANRIHAFMKKALLAADCAGYDDEQKQAMKKDFRTMTPQYRKLTAEEKQEQHVAIENEHAAFAQLKEASRFVRMAKGYDD